MLSRRNVRVKVMQLLYAQKQDAAMSGRACEQAFDKMIEQSYQNLLFDLYVFVNVLAVSRDEQKRNKKKLRPTEDDLAFKPNLRDNGLIKALSESPELSDAIIKYHFAEALDKEKLRGFYDTATSWEGYKEYASAKTPSADEHLGAILKAHKALMDSEVYNDYLEDNFARWDEDKSLIVGTVKKILKALPQSALVLSTFRPDDETRKDFGEHLLHFILEKDTELQGYIEPVLQNWDAERVAVLDMILIKMALGELLSFSQIPPKVTLNEYVELAKTYSTDKSKEFINGILDRLLHSLRETGMIVKEGRGLIE